MVRTLLVNLCRLVLATVFILSGLVKIIDPRGFSYKIDEYAGAAGITDFHLAHASLLFAAAVAMLEFSAGIYLFFGIRRRLTSLVTLLMMTVFAALTFWSWRWHAVSDCGCFGDVIHLTPAETFFKNVVLLLLCLPLVRHPRAQVRFISEKSQWTIGLYVWIYGAALCAYNVYMLPVMDFRPYHIGADLLRAMQPADAGDVRYTHTFIMEKDGERREFSLEDYPDSTWTFVDRRTRIEGSAKALPPIHDLSIVSPSTGIDTTEALLSGEGWKFLIVAPDLREADDGVMERLAELTDYCSHYGYPLYCLTASNEEDIRYWQDITGAEYPYLLADRTPLRTMVRSNPGLVVLKGSTVKAKFPAIGLPSETELTDRAERLALLSPDLETHLRMLLRLLLWFVGPLFILTLLDNLYRLIIHIKNKKRIMRKHIVAGNWKMNKNLQEGVALAKELKEILAAEKPNCDVIIGTPFIHLATVADLLKDSCIAVSAENCADKESGAYTGEVSAAMVKSTGAEYVILGHSERREYYHETPAILKEKVDLALANGLKVIFCIGESLAEREANQQEAVCKAELQGSVFHLSAEQWKNIVIAYEPIWAIGTGKTATAEQAEEIHAFIRKCVAEVYGEAAAQETSILYGGSCKASNAPELFGKEDIDGGLIGGASLKAPDFKGIIDAWK